MQQWNELRLLREAHGCGPEFGEGEMRTCWRAGGELSEQLVVIGVHLPESEEGVVLGDARMPGVSPRRC